MQERKVLLFILPIYIYSIHSIHFYPYIQIKTPIFTIGNMGCQSISRNLGLGVEESFRIKPCPGRQHENSFASKAV